MQATKGTKKAASRTLVWPDKEVASTLGIGNKGHKLGGKVLGLRQGLFWGLTPKRVKTLSSSSNMIVLPYDLLVITA